MARLRYLEHVGTRARKRQKKQREATRERSRFTRVQRATIDNEAGDRVPPTVEGYVAAAIEGEHHVGRALIARHNQRMLAIPGLSTGLHQELLSSASPVVHLQIALLAMGASQHRPPSATGGEPTDQLMWGVDSVIAACRLMLCGQIAGAAGIMRSQIESWASAKASAATYTKLEGDSDADFIAIAWSLLSGYEALGDITEDVYIFERQDRVEREESHPVVPHRHVFSRDNRELCPAMLWSVLSELLHGRDFRGAFKWDATCLTGSPDDSVRDATLLIADSIRIVLRSIRLSAIGLARSLNNQLAESLLLAGLEEFSERPADEVPTASPTVEEAPRRLVVPPLMHLAPLTPDEGLSGDVLLSLQARARDWMTLNRGQRPAGRLYRDDEILSVAFSWTRWRSALTASVALEHEKLTLGKRSRPDTLRIRTTSWIHVTESLSLLSTWENDERPSSSLALLASSLRSGWWLWLEDDDRAMAMFRYALEQLARTRVWRINPEKAEKLTTRSAPRDWLKAAGLKRLGPLNKALGDFTHQLPWADVQAGRQLLEGMQANSDSRDARHTARRSAAELITALAADEATRRAEQYAAPLGEVLAKVLLPARALAGSTNTTRPDTLDSYLDLVWSYRATGP